MMVCAPWGHRVLEGVRVRQQTAGFEIRERGVLLNAVSGKQEHPKLPYHTVGALH